MMTEKQQKEEQRRIDEYFLKITSREIKKKCVKEEQEIKHQRRIDEHFFKISRENISVKEEIEYQRRIDEFKERYPKAKDFGVWAWTLMDKDKAISKLNNLKLKINDKST